MTLIKIYQLHFDNEHYDYFVPEQDLPISELHTFDGRSKKNEWKPLTVRLANWRKGMELSDAPCCIFPVFRREVLDALHTEDEVEKKELYGALHKALTELEPEEQLLIKLLFYDRKTERECAAVSGISQKNLHKKKVLVLGKLNKLLKNFII